MPDKPKDDQAKANKTPVDEPETKPIGFGGSPWGGMQPTPEPEPETPQIPIPEQPFGEDK